MHAGNEFLAGADIRRRPRCRMWRPDVKDGHDSVIFLLVAAGDGAIVRACRLCLEDNLIVDIRNVANQGHVIVKGVEKAPENIENNR